MMPRYSTGTLYRYGAQSHPAFGGAARGPGALGKKERATHVSNKSPKGRQAVSTNRKEKEFEMLLRHAARLQAIRRSAQQKRASAKTA